LKKFDTSLYLITDSSIGHEKMIEQVKQAIEGGVTFVQLREKTGTTREMIDIATKLHEVTKAYGVPLIIDDRVDVALAAGVEGVHLGKEDMPIDIARKIIGEDKIIGATAKTVEAALDAYNKGADYLGVGAIYPTTTKVKTVITSVDTLKAICTAVPIPVNAIGGLNKDNACVLKDVDIDGICVVSAIMKAEDAKKAAQELKGWRK